MKLVLVLDNRIPQFNGIQIHPADIVISNGKLDSHPNVKDINDTKIDYHLYTKKWDDTINKLFVTGNLSQDTRDLILAASPNIFLHNFKALVLWIETLKELINSRDDIKEILISDFVLSSYFPLYEAEGEINAGLFYKKYDFISKCVYDYIRNNYPKLNVRIYRKRSSVSLYFRIFMRRYALLIIKSLIHFKNIIIANDRKDISYPNVQLLLISRGLAHSNYVKEFFLKHPWVYIHTSDGLYSKGENTSYLKSLDKNRTINLYEYLSLKDLFYVIISSVKRIYSVKLPTVDVNGIKINLKSLFKEIAISQIEVDLNVKSVENFVQNIKGNYKVATCEMVTSYPLFLKKTLSIQRNNLGVFQLQTTSLDLFECPNFVHTDGFLFKSENDLSFFKEVFKQDLNKLKFFGNLSYDKTNQSLKRIEVKNAVYFTQPYENEIQISIINYLHRLSNKLGFKLYIKPHPREDVGGLQKKLLGLNIDFLPKEMDVLATSKIADMVIIRTSSLTQDFFINCVPTINVLLSDFDRNLKVEYLKSQQINIVNSLDEIEQYFLNYAYFCHCYQEFCMSYLHTTGITKDINDFAHEIQHNASK